jgi:hypothetical protein
MSELFSLDESKRAEEKLELALSQAFLGLDESKMANKANTQSILSCFHSADESQIALALSRSYLAQIRARELKKV